MNLSKELLKLFKLLFPSDASVGDQVYGINKPHIDLWGSVSQSVCKHSVKHLFVAKSGKNICISITISRRIKPTGNIIITLLLKRQVVLYYPENCVFTNEHTCLLGISATSSAALNQS